MVFIPSFGNKKFLCVGGNNEIAKTNLNFQSTLEIFATLSFNWSLFFTFTRKILVLRNFKTSDMGNFKEIMRLNLRTAKNSRCKIMPKVVFFFFYVQFEFKLRLFWRGSFHMLLNLRIKPVITQL